MVSLKSLSVLDKVASSAGDAFTFAAMVAMATAVAFAGALNLLAIFQYSPNTGWLAFFSFLASWLVTSLVGVICAFLPVFLTSFFVCAARGFSRYNFLSFAVLAATVACFGSLFLAFGNAKTAPSSTIAFPVTVAIVVYVWMSLKLIWEPKTATL